MLIPAFAATYRQYWPLAVDEVYWHGEPLAAILAQDKYVAEDAAAAVEVDYEPLPVVTDAEAALRDGAPRVYDDWDNNEIFGTSCTGGFDSGRDRRERRRGRGVVRQGRRGAQATLPHPPLRCLPHRDPRRARDLERVRTG